MHDGLVNYKGDRNGWLCQQIGIAYEVSVVRVANCRVLRVVARSDHRHPQSLIPALFEGSFDGGP